MGHFCAWGITISDGRRRLNEFKDKMVKENPTLVKNMKHVKWRAIPPLKGPNPKGLIKEKKQDKPIQEKKYGRY